MQMRKLGATQQNGFFRGLLSPVNLFLVLILFFAQLQVSLADITNDAQAVGTYEGGTVNSTVDSEAIPVIPADFQLAVDKTGVLNDNDGTPGLSAGDTITYTVEVTNPGTRSLTGITVNDPLVALNFIGGDDDNDSEIDPSETWVYTADYTITPTDLSTNGGGDGDIDNTVTADSIETPPAFDADEVLINPLVSILVEKTGTLNDDDGTLGLSAGDTIDYVINVTNNGVTSLTNVVLTDTLTQSGVDTTLTPGVPSGDLNNNSQIDAGEIFTYTLSYTLTQPNIDDGSDIVNTVSVLTDQIGPREDDDIQPLSGFIDSFTMTKLASLNDLDADNLGDENEIIDYTFTFTNTGNRALTNLRANDPLPGLSAISCPGDIDNDGDIDTLAPGVSAICTANYSIQAGDVINGLVNNTATTSATRIGGLVPVVEDDTANDNSTVTPTDTNFEVQVRKTVASAVEVLTNVVEVDYIIEIENIGSITQTNITAEDDITAAINAPALLLGDASIINISGFTGTGIANAAFNGSSITQLLSGDVQLAANATGQIRVRVLVDRRSQTLVTSNIALVTTDQITGTVPSDDPNETPGNTGDNNPTPFDSPDFDQDGSPDVNESPVADRDGDGISDQEDYDPTGYFYCEANGRILTGGRIAVQNLTTGGIQTGVGSSNDITILHDGSSGFYQFYTTAPGTFRLIPTLPTGGIASTTRLSSGSLDVSTLLPNNPAVLGGGEIGSTGVLHDFTQAGNPFYTDFVIERGDPTVFNNNIPLELCGTPQLATTKVIVDEPITNPDGTTDVTFNLTVQNTGTLHAVDLSLTDDLNAVFGTGNFTVSENEITASPVTFGANSNPFYNGSSNVELLTSGGRLEPGESIQITMLVNVTADPGSFTNTSIAGGFDPSENLGGAGPGVNIPLPNVSATASFVIAPTILDNVFVATKTTTVDSARLGEIVPYTLTFRNTADFTVRDVEFVDIMPRGFTYVSNSASIDGVPVEPTTADLQRLVWSGREVASGATSTLTLSLRLGAGIKGTKFTNTTFAWDPQNRNEISNQARAVIELEIESVFQCSHVIGRVFDDLDKDGYHDPGEPGLGGVRVVSVNGLLITTDQYGRYHVTCDSVPNESIGSNYILKLDTRTLPTGYIVTSENPRVVRLTQGKISKINFAAANLRVVRVELSDDSFEGQGSGLKRETLQNLGKILALLGQERSVLELDYASTGSIDNTRNSRLRSVKKLMLNAWKKQSKDYPLEVIIKSGRYNSTPARSNGQPQLQQGIQGEEIIKK